MGDPKKPRKKFSSPKMPWITDQLSKELYTVGTYGLRNKRELWKAHAQLSKIRKQARMLLAEPSELRLKKEKELLSSLFNKGFININANLEDILELTVENLLERRLQTIIWRKGIALSPYQARQMITHRHILLGNNKITRPSYIVKKDEENTVRLNEKSPIKKQVLSTEVKENE